MGTIRKTELEFSLAKAQLLNEVENYIEKNKIKLNELPGFHFEQGETRFIFVVDQISGDDIFKALEIIKAHSKILGVHTLEAGYSIFQEGEIGRNGIKYRFVYIGKQSRVEISRAGNFTQDEIQSCVRLFKLFHENRASSDPDKILAQLGVPVYKTKNKEKTIPLHDIQEFNKKHKLAGYNKTKEEILENVILPLGKPEIFRDVAMLTRGSDKGVLPKAVLFEGPPGVGKTSMARIIAAETRIPLVYVPVENITSKYYGESARNMSAIFEAASMYDQVIIFLDEIDSLGLTREGGLFEASRRVLSVLLRKIDGMDSKPGVLTIGATNRREDLDGALLSRFDTIIHFPMPNAAERSLIFKRFANHLDVDELMIIGKKSDGLSGRNIEDICEFVERKWARKLLKENKNASAPVADLYIAALENRRE